MIAITATALCRDCDWTAEGDWEPVDRGAERHMRTAGHSTTTRARPHHDPRPATARRPAPKENHDQ